MAHGHVIYASSQVWCCATYTHTHHCSQLYMCCLIHMNLIKPDAHNCQDISNLTRHPSTVGRLEQYVCRQTTPGTWHKWRILLSGSPAVALALAIRAFFMNCSRGSHRNATQGGGAGEGRILLKPPTLQTQLHIHVQ